MNGFNLFNRFIPQATESRVVTNPIIIDRNCSLSLTLIGGLTIALMSCTRNFGGVVKGWAGKNGNIIKWWWRFCLRNIADLYYKFFTYNLCNSYIIHVYLISYIILCNFFIYILCHVITYIKMSCSCLFQFSVPLHETFFGWLRSRTLWKLCCIMAYFLINGLRHFFWSFV